MEQGMLDKMKTFFGFQEEEELLSKEQSLPLVKAPKKVMTVPVNQSASVTEIRIEEPRIYEDSLNIATFLRELKPVIVNLKHLESDAGKRLIDFICGTAYAINGHMLKIGEQIFLFTPPNVMITEPSEKTPLQQGLEEEQKQHFFSRVNLAGD